MIAPPQPQQIKGKGRVEGGSNRKNRKREKTTDIYLLPTQQTELTIFS